MKQITCLLFLFYALIGFGQSEIDYTKTIDQISASYNSNNAKEIFDLFSTDLQAEMNMAAVEGLIANNLDKKGKMGSHTYLFEDESGKRYLIELEQGSMVLVLMLNADKKLTVLGLEEY